VPTASRDCAASVDGYPAAPADAPAASVFHVRVGAPVGGAEGSVARPYPSLATALAGVGERRLRRAWILLADGAHDASARVAMGRPVEVTVLGSCPARASLVAPLDAPALVALGEATAVTLRGLTVRGGRYSVQARDGAVVAVTGSVVRDAVGAGVLAYRASVRVEDSLLATVRRAGGAGGTGVYGEREGRITVARSAIVGAEAAGVLAERGSEVSVDDVAIRGPGSVAVSTQGGATLTASRAVIDRVGGFQALGAKSAMTLRDVVVRRTGGAASNGVAAGDGATVEVTRLTALHCSGPAVLSQDGARITLTEALLRGADGAGETPYGLAADRDGALTARRVLVRARAGVGASVQGGSLTLEDAWIDGVAAVTPGRSVGVLVADGGRASLRRARVEGAAGVGIAALEPASEVDVEDALVTAIAVGRLTAGAREATGAGIAATAGASIRATRVLVFDTDERAVTASSGARLSLERSVVERSRPRAGAPVDESYGLGVVAAAGAAVAVRGSVLRAHPGVAAVSAEGGSLALEDSLVGDAPERADAFGTGLQVLWGSALQATRVVVADVRHAGVLAFAGADGGRGAARVELRDVIVRGVRPSPTGQGVGVAAVGDVALSAERLAVVDASGMGVALVGAAGTATLRDLFVRRVTRATFAQELGTPGVAVANALEVRGGARATVARAVLDGAGADWGILHHRADLTLSDARITRMRLGAGRVDLARPDSFRARGVVVTESSREGFLDSDGAALAPLPVPSSICAEPPCR